MANSAKATTEVKIRTPRKLKKILSKQAAKK